MKQRLQMYNSPYKSITDCIRRTYRTEGIQAFYRSYTTQLAMNIPFQIIHFMTYERCQNITNKERVYNPKAHVISGAVAGKYNDSIRISENYIFINTNIFVSQEPWLQLLLLRWTL